MTILNYQYVFAYMDAKEFLSPNFRGCGLETTTKIISDKIDLLVEVILGKYLSGSAGQGKVLNHLGFPPLYN